MDVNKSKFVDKTVLHTPKPTACSTVNKKHFQKKMHSDNVSLESSLGIINVKDLSNISNEQIHNLSTNSDLSYQLRQQHELANNSLQRANKVAGLPSKYLKPNFSKSSNLSLTNESTISESDMTRSLHKSPKNTSTPRESMASNNSAENSLPRLSLGQSMAQLSYQIGNTDISIDNFVKEFQKAMNSDKSVPQVDSQMFSPAEEAASMLLADEMSWRRKNEIPVNNTLSKTSNEDTSYGKVSMGAFFQQKSDTLSDFKMALSPVKSKNPIPLIDSSISFKEEPQIEKGKKSNKSLSISAIRKVLAETDDTPRKVTSYLLKQGQKLSEHSVDNSSLPVSKNSSYTSNYSDNEAMQHFHTNKENVDTYNLQTSRSPRDSRSSESHTRPTSASSTRSLSSALTSLPNGKLPIESTKTELIWGCVKVDRCVTQEFLLRNKTSKRLCIQMSIAGHDFKIRKDNRQESEPLSAAKILLHPHESRAVIVSFIPTRVGAAIDELVFSSLDANLQQTRKQLVKLYGYGGFGKIDIVNLTKDVSGKFLLGLGKLNNHNVITRSFIIQNNGTLPCFAYINFNAKDLFAFSNVSVKPQCSVLIPKEQKEILVTFVPTTEDYQTLQRHLFSNSMVAEIGNLVIISGTEVNRGRLRRQCRKSMEKGLQIDAVSKILNEKISGEVMPADLSRFKEAPGNLREILRLFTRNEVVVTVEQDPEVTIMPHYPDESGIFHTLCQDNTLNYLDSTTMQISCKLEPTSIILVPPTKTKDSLFLISDCKKQQHFEVVSNPAGLEISPRDGIIAPGQEILINISCSKLSARDKRLFNVLVYVEHEVFEATVKITYIHSQSQGRNSD